MALLRVQTSLVAGFIHAENTIGRTERKIKFGFPMPLSAQQRSGL
jgi:hypothetical protein